MYRILPQKHIGSGTEGTQVNPQTWRAVLVGLEHTSTSSSRSGQYAMGLTKAENPHRGHAATSDPSERGDCIEWVMRAPPMGEETALASTRTMSGAEMLRESDTFLVWRLFPWEDLEVPEERLVEGLRGGLLVVALLLLLALAYSMPTVGIGGTTPSDGGHSRCPCESCMRSKRREASEREKKEADDTTR